MKYNDLLWAAVFVAAIYALTGNLTENAILFGAILISLAIKECCNKCNKG